MAKEVMSPTGKLVKKVAEVAATPLRAVAEAVRPGRAGKSKGASAGKSGGGEKAKAPGVRPVPVVAKEQARATFESLKAIHPDAHCELVHRNAFELLCATVLSAQTTDVAVNKALPKLFAAFPTAEILAAAEPSEVEPYVAALGFFRQKSKALVGLARALVKSHGGQVPQSLDELIKLPGVGRKTANVVLGVIWNTPEGVVVDTHVQRLAQRLRWTKETEPAKIEQDLSRLLPRDQWNSVGHTLIFHGRRVCFAIKPQCGACGINDTCPSAFEAELIGRKRLPPR